MPIYEFVCRDCNTVYQFFSKRVDPEKVPPCPKEPGHAPLERMMSRFALGRAASKGETSPESADPASEEARVPDDPRMEARMTELMSRMESVDENDGRAMGRMMRELASLAGEGADDPAMQETIRRLEAGEDPEKVEEIVADAYGEESLGAGGSGGAPAYDGGLYDM